MLRALVCAWLGWIACGAAYAQVPNAPSGLAATVASAGQINLAWTDNSTNETSFKIERKPAGGAYAQIGTTSTNVVTYQSSGLLASSTYFFRVRSSNASGNSTTYSNEVSVTTPAKPAGLVAAYSFNENTGTALGDVSGGGFNGTLTNGPTWTAGKYASALQFTASDDGNDNNDPRVVLGRTINIPNLPLTISAWVNPTNYNDYRAIISKRDTPTGSDMRLDIGLTQTTGLVYVFVGGSPFQFSYAPPVNTWTNLAVVADSSSTRLYANGTLQSTIAAITLGTDTTANTVIGGSGEGTGGDNDPFNGKIDDLRIYSRALTQTEIQTDMNTPVGGVAPPPDTAAPSTPTGLSTTVVSSTQINLTWTASTDNVGVSGYQIDRCQGASCTQVGTATTTTFNNTGLTASTSYSYRVRATDAAGNVSANSTVVSATTPAAPDTVAPTAPSTISATVVSSTQINLSWTASTDNVGVTGYQIDRCLSAGCSTFTQIGTSATTTFNNTGLTASTSYSYRVRATDAAGNVSANSATSTAVTQAPPDTTAPTAPSTISATVVSSTQINLSWTASTDNVGVTGYQIDRCLSAGCSTFTQIATSSVPSFSNTGLTASTTYRYQVRATDAAGNVSANSSIVTSTTSAPPDTVAPSAPTGVGATAASSTQINLNWTSSTDNVAVTGYQIDRCLGPSCSTFAQIGTSSITTLSDTGLAASTSYSYRVRATDAAGNVSANSSTVSSTTLAAPDTVAPSAPTGPGATAASSTQVNLTWIASTDNIGVTGYQIDRCQDASCATFTQIATSATNSFSNTGLSASTSYSYRVRATDAAGNVSANSSAVSTTTLAAPPSAPVQLGAIGSLSQGLNSPPVTSLSWKDTSSDETGFKIERSVNAPGTWVLIATTAANATTFTDAGVSSGTLYYYRIRATNSGGDSAPSNEASAGTATPNANVSSTRLTFKYDPFGNLIQTTASSFQTTAGASVTKLTYDRRGRKTTMSDPDLGNPAAGKIWNYSYNALGEMVRQTDPMGQKAEMTYDVLGRMTQRVESDPNPTARPGLTSKWFYDAYPDGSNPAVPIPTEWDPSFRTGLSNDCTKGKGKLCFVATDTGYRQVLTYDIFGRSSETNTKIDTMYKALVGYDDFDRVSAVTYPQDAQPYTVTNTYHPSSGHLQKVANATTQAVIWERQSVTISQIETVFTDRLGTLRYPSERRYDAADRLTSAKAFNGSIMSFAYSYDAVGNVAQRTDNTMGVVESFTYDRLNRLVLASGSSPSGALVTRSTDYDWNGNILYKSDAGSYTYGAPAQGCSGGPHAVTRVAGTVNAAYCYDDNGNLTTGAGRTVTYTTFNLPATIVQGTDQFEYRYNASHQRALLNVTRASGLFTSIYLHPAGGGRLFYEKETKPDGTVEHRHYINAADLVGVHVKDNHGVDEMRYYHLDNLGSIVAISNEVGTRTEQLAFEAFGKRRNPNGTPDPTNQLIGLLTDRGFTGHEHLDEIGLIHMNGRVYDPLLGRFMTADPTVQSAGNAQTYNRYSYAGNNPLARVDPTGFGWGSRLRHFWSSVKQYDPISNWLSAMHGILTGNLSEAMLGSSHAFSPSTIWVDKYVRNHPNLAPYYQMAMTAACTIGSAGTAAPECAAGASMYTIAVVGGGNRDILKAGAIAYGTALAMNAVGDVTGHNPDFMSGPHLANIAGHALVGCASAAAGGGDCRSGAMSGAFGSLVAPATSSLSSVGGLVASMVVGGTASALSGGSFANGAKTSAFGYLFNQLGGQCSCRSGGTYYTGDTAFDAALNNTGTPPSLIDRIVGAIGNVFFNTPSTGEPGSWHTNPGSGQERQYGKDGKPDVDIDWDHAHGGSSSPHGHNWDRGPDGTPVRGDPVDISPWPKGRTSP